MIQLKMTKISCQIFTKPFSLSALKLWYHTPYWYSKWLQHLSYSWPFLLFSETSIKSMLSFDRGYANQKILLLIFLNKHPGGHCSFLYKDFEIDIFHRDISDKLLDGDSVDHMNPKNTLLSIGLMEIYGLF